MSAEQNLLRRGNVVAEAASNTIDLFVAGLRPVEDLEARSAELKAWAADVRAVSSEQKP